MGLKAMINWFANCYLRTTFCTKNLFLVYQSDLGICWDFFWVKGWEEVENMLWKFIVLAEFCGRRYRVSEC